MASSLASPVDRDGRSALPFPAPPTHGFSTMLLSVTDSPPVEDFVPPFSLDPLMIGSFIMWQSMDNPVEFLHQENLNFFPVQLGRSIEVPSSGGNNINMLNNHVPAVTHDNGLKMYDKKEQQCSHPAIFVHLTALTINPSSYSLLKIKNHVNSVEQMAFGPELVDEKAMVYNDLDKIALLSMNCDAHKKTMHNYHDHILMNYDLLKLQFVPGLPSIPLCSKFLAEPFHGIESLNACFSCYAGEHDVNTWVLPIERPLGPGANSSTGFAATFLWLDSGCTHHVVCDYRLLVNCRAPPAGKNVRIADGSLMPVRAVGTINIPGFCIPEVYFVPGAALNLISPGQLAVDHKINSALDAVSCILWTGQRIDLVGEGIRDERHGLYRLTFLVVP
ncbi:uncharacterized protein LOC133907062 [Phragmites australis]|uniref:uncharacterized protein LOC133907062 n=1 Tax=Phragmites australis TaxID=29695 RepID=UPI002D79799D|nr:uncharacterized protein LOC133907062 [Phragmites australis]